MAFLRTSPFSSATSTLLCFLASCASPSGSDGDSALPEREFEIEIDRPSDSTNRLVVDLDALVSNWLALYEAQPVRDPAEKARRDATRKTTREAIEKRIAENEDVLVDVLMHGKSETQREQVARALGLGGSTRVHEVLIALLEGGQARPPLTQRLMVGLGLGARAETPLAPFLAYLAPDHHVALRDTASWAVLKIALAGGGTNAEGILLSESLEDESVVVRRHVARALAEEGLRNTQGTNRVIEALADEAQSVRVAAIETLGLLEHAEASPRLVPLLEDVDPLVRQRARWALRRIHGRDLGVDPDSWRAVIGNSGTSSAPNRG